MRLNLAGVIPGLLLLSTAALASEPASWMVGRAPGIEVHVPAMIENGTRSMKLEDFAPMAGKAWAKANHKSGDFLMLPVVVVGAGPIPPGATLMVALRRGFRAMVWADWQEQVSASPDSGASYQGLAVFQAFRLKDVVEVEYVDGKRRIVLTTEE